MREVYGSAKLSRIERRQNTAYNMAESFRMKYYMERRIFTAPDWKIVSLTRGLKGGMPHDAETRLVLQCKSSSDATVRHSRRAAKKKGGAGRGGDS